MGLETIFFELHLNVDTTGNRALHTLCELNHLKVEAFQ